MTLPPPFVNRHTVNNNTDNFNNIFVISFLPFNSLHPKIFRDVIQLYELLAYLLKYCRVDTNGLYNVICPINFLFICIASRWPLIAHPSIQNDITQTLLQNRHSSIEVSFMYCRIISGLDLYCAALVFMNICAQF